MSDDLQPTDEPVSADNVTPIGAAKAKRQRKPKEERHPNAPPADFARGDHVELARELVLDLEAGGEPLAYDEGQLYRYDPERGIWSALELHEMSRVLVGYAGKLVESDRGRPKPMKVNVTSIDGAITVAKRVKTRRDFFDGRRPGLAFTNGFVTVGPDRVDLVRHSPDHRARASLPFAYDPCAKYTRWLQFLDEVFRDDEDRAEKARLLQQFFGMCLLGEATSMQVALVLTGDGANGKGVLMNTLLEVFPRAEQRAVPPQLWGQEYHRASLAGVRINVVAELPEREILDEASVKAVITGDPITGRHIREAPFTFTPIAGHVFAANTLPGVSDRSHGFWRRLMVVPFNRVFEEHEKDRGLKRWFVENELAGIVGWGLAGAADYLANGLARPPSSTEATETWKREANPVAVWIDEMMAPVASDEVSWWTPSTKLLETFNTWAEKTGHRKVSSTK
jgi:putative DNA primase/helicase